MSLQQRKRNFHIHIRQRKRKTKVSKITQKHTTHSKEASCRKKGASVSAVHLKSPLERRSLREALWRRAAASDYNHTPLESLYLNEKKHTPRTSARRFSLSTLFPPRVAWRSLFSAAARHQKKVFILIAEN